jgi:hypothetical protein
MHISVYLWVACAMRMKRGGARQPCHSARYTECLNVVWSDLDDSESKDEDKVTLTGVIPDSRSTCDKIRESELKAKQS